jgi:hypothetical protein
MAVIDIFPSSLLILLIDKQNERRFLNEASSIENARESLLPPFQTREALTFPSIPIGQSP